MSTIILFLPLAGSILVFFLGLIAWVQDSKSRVNFTFTLFTSTITIWLFATFMMFLNRGDIFAALFWDKFVYVGVVFIPAVMFHFGLALTSDQRKFNQALLNLAYALSFFFLFLIPGNLFVDDVFLYKWGAHTKAQFFHHIFLIYFTAFLLLWFIIVYKYYKRTLVSAERSKLKIVFLSFFILATIGSLGFLPAYEIGIYPFSYISGILFTVILSYAIFRHHLFNIKLIATELLVFFIWMAMFVEVMLAKTFRERVVEGAILIFVVVFGILIVKSVLNEVKRKEDLEKISKMLRRANARLRELDKAKSEFVSIASHQLRSPLTVIKGYSSMMLEGSFGKITNEARVAAERMFESSERLISFVNELLDMSRIERGKMQYDLEDADIAEITKSVFEELRGVAEEKGLKFEFLAPTSATPRLKLDKIKIRQVITNLIDNAIKYTPKGEVVIAISRSGENVEVSVKDTGVGMSAEDIAELFGRFKRADGAVKINSEGSGLGLFVAREIARGHGGEVTARSEGKGRGSEFVLKLPIRS